MGKEDADNVIPLFRDGVQRSVDGHVSGNPERIGKIVTSLLRTATPNIKPYDWADGENETPDEPEDNPPTPA